MLSFWEKSTLVHHDLIVVGSGIVGLSAALHYQLAHPKKKVAVIERGLFPSGASTKKRRVHLLWIHLRIGRKCTNRFPR